MSPSTQGTFRNVCQPHGRKKYLVFISQWDHDVARKSAPASIATRVSCAVQASFSVSTHSHVASRGSGGGATVAMPTRSDAGTVPHTSNVSRAVRSSSLATGGAARCSAAGERLMAGHRPTVFGRVESAGAKSDCVLDVLKCSTTPWAPRSDLHHRSGRGVFERL